MRYRKIGNAICDPTSEEAKALVGQMVVYGAAYVDLFKRLRYPNIGRLEQICEERPHPFLIVRSDDFGSSYFKMICAVEEVPEEKKYRPYTLEEAVKLIGKVYRNKRNGKERIIYESVSYVAESREGVLIIGGNKVEDFMKNFEWYNPETGETEPIGVEVKE